MKKYTRILLAFFIFFLVLYGPVLAKEEISLESNPGEDRISPVAAEEGSRPLTPSPHAQAGKKEESISTEKDPKMSLTGGEERSTREEDKDKPAEPAYKEAEKDRQGKMSEDKSRPLKTPSKAKEAKDLDLLELGPEITPGSVGGGSSGGGSAGVTSSQMKGKDYLATPGFKLLKLAGDSKKPMQVVFKIMKLDPKDPSKVLESHLVTTDEKGYLNPLYLENITTDRDTYVQLYKEFFQASSAEILLNRFLPSPWEPLAPEEPDTKEEDWPDLHKKKGSPEQPMPGKDPNLEPGVGHGAWGFEGSGGSGGWVGPGSPSRPDHGPDSTNKPKSEPIEANKNDKFLDKPPRVFDAYEKNEPVVFTTNNGGNLKVRIEYGKLSPDPDGPDLPLSPGPDLPSPPGPYGPYGVKEKKIPFDQTDEKTYDFNLEDFDKEGYLRKLSDFAKGRLYTLLKDKPLEPKEKAYYKLSYRRTRSTPAIYKMEELATDTNKGYKLEHFYLKVDRDGSIYKGSSLEKIDQKIVDSFEIRYNILESKRDRINKEILDLRKNQWALLKSIRLESDTPSSYKLTIKDLGKRSPLDIREYSREEPGVIPSDGMSFYREIPIRDYDKEESFSSWEDLEAYLKSLDYLSSNLNFYLNSPSPRDQRGYGQFELANGYGLSFYKEAPCFVGDKKFETVYDAMTYLEEIAHPRNRELEEKIDELDRLKGWLEDHPETIKPRLKKAYENWQDLKRKQDLVLLDLAPSDPKDFPKDLKNYKIRIYDDALLGSNFKIRRFGPVYYSGRSLGQWAAESNRKRLYLDRSGIKFSYKTKSFRSYDELKDWYYNNDLDKIDILVEKAAEEVDALARQSFRPSLNPLALFTLENQPDTPPPPGDTPPPPPGDTPPPPGDTPPPPEDTPPPPKVTPPPEEVVREGKKVKIKGVEPLKKPPIKTDQPRPVKKYISKGAPKTYDPGLGPYGYTALLSGLGLEIIRRKKNKKI